MNLRFIFFFSSSLPTHKIICPHSFRQADGLRQSVAPDEQIHLNPFGGAVFVNRQAERAQRTALHANDENRGTVRLRRQDSRQQSEIAQFIVGHKRLPIASIFIRRTLTRSERIRCESDVLLLMVMLSNPAHRAHKHCPSRQATRRREGYTARPRCVILSAKLLTKAHLNPRGSSQGAGRLCE